MNICWLLILALITHTSFTSNCIESDHTAPCECSLSKYGCDTNLNDCTWSFSKCVNTSTLDLIIVGSPTDPRPNATASASTPSPITPTAPTTPMPTTASPTTSEPTTVSPTTSKAPTSSPTTSSPTAAPTFNITDILKAPPVLNLTCGDTVQHFWPRQLTVFTIEIPFDSPSVTIAACNSNFDTVLELYEDANLTSLIQADDNGCTNGNVNASILKIKDGLEADIYFMELSTEPIIQEGIYQIQVICDTFEPTADPTTTAIPTAAPTTTTTTGNPTKATTQRPSKPPTISKDDSDDSDDSSVSDSDSDEWWMPTPRPTKGVYEAPSECTKNCDAFKVKLLYYGRLSEYDTDYVDYDTISRESSSDNSKSSRRRLGFESDWRGSGSDSGSDSGSGSGSGSGESGEYLDDDYEIDVVCYTYEVKRIFDDGVCYDKVNEIVLGACGSDYNRVNYKDLEGLILKKYGGDLYEGFRDFGSGEITGIRVNVEVDDDPIAFTLCMNGVNDDGFTSGLVRFERDNVGSYLCRDEGNDGLPCLRDEYKNNVYQLKSDLFQAAAEGTHEYDDEDLQVVEQYKSRDLVSNILAGILLFVITIMVVVAVFYVCVSHEKSWLHSAVEKWAPNMNWTADEEGNTNNNNNNYLYSSDPTDATDVSNISLSSSVEFEDEIELCNVKKPTRRTHSYNVNRHYSQQSSKDDTISSLERVDNMGYCEAPPTKWNGSMQSTQSPSPGDDMMRQGVHQSLLSNPFGDDKIGILKEHIYEEQELDMTPESKFSNIDRNDRIMEMERNARMEMERHGSDSKESKESIDNHSSSADVMYKESNNSNGNNNNGRRRRNYDGNRNNTVIIKREQHGSMEFDKNSRRSSTTSTNDGMTVLSNYDEYNNKMFPISESGGDDNDAINSDGTNHTVSTDASRLTANVINAVRYNGNAGFYE